MKMSVDAYKELIEGNMRWLGNQEQCCERSHIMGIVKDSTNFYYPKSYKESLEQLQKDNAELVKVLREAADDFNEAAGVLFEINEPEMDHAFKCMRDKYRAIADRLEVKE